MLINSKNLDTLRTGFTKFYNDSFSAVTPDWSKLAMLVNSTGPDQKYGWLGMIPGFREWLGERVVNNLSSSDFTIKNKAFENTVGVKRDDIEDDNLGIYAPMFQMLGDNAAKHPDTLVFNLLSTAFTALCYDGQFFVDTDHPVLDVNGVPQSVSNSGGGSGAPWFLLDTSKPIKPLIYQKRRDYEFVAKDASDDENVFNKREFVYGTDGRGNAGFGLWQLGYGSKQTLDAAAYATAVANLEGRKGDYGVPLGLKGTLLVCGPSNKAAAQAILSASTLPNGGANVNYNTAALLVTPYLT